MVLSMLRSYGKIGPQIDQIWAWLSRGHRWSPRVRNPLKSLVTGPSLLVNCYLEIKFHKIIRVNPPPPPLNNGNKTNDIYFTAQYKSFTSCCRDVFTIINNYLRLFESRYNLEIKLIFRLNSASHSLTLHSHFSILHV